MINKEEITSAIPTLVLEQPTPTISIVPEPVSKPAPTKLPPPTSLPSSSSSSSSSLQWEQLPSLEDLKGTFQEKMLAVVEGFSNLFYSY